MNKCCFFFTECRLSIKFDPAYYGNDVTSTVTSRARYEVNQYGLLPSNDKPIIGMPAYPYLVTKLFTASANIEEKKTAIDVDVSIRQLSENFGSFRY